MIGRSLRWRLLAGAGVAIAVALALAWAAMGWVFDRHIEGRVQDELTSQAVPLLAGLTVANGVPAIDGEPADPRFGVPASGLYWQIDNGRGQLRSRSLWDSALPRAADAPADAWRARRAMGPFGQRLLIVERQVQPEKSQPAATVRLAYDLAQLAPAHREFGREMALFLALLWLVLSIAAWVQVNLGLRPLANMENEVRRLRADASARLAEAYPAELAPLTRAIDALADAREADVVRARRRAADLAHGLKTPLAALAVQSAHARNAGAKDAADGLDAAIAAVRAAVDGELARTRIGLVVSEGRATAALPLIERLIEVIERTELGERIVFSVEGDSGVMLPLAGDDGAELLGPLLENAARHARRRVTVAVHPRQVVIGDDGPGLDAERHGDAVLRGARLDSSGDGHGLGLAIARDLAEAMGGTLQLAASPLGGLEVRLAWTA